MQSKHTHKMPSLLFWILQWPYSFVAATNIDTFQKPYAARLQRISSYVSLNVQHKKFLIEILGSDRHFTSVISLLCNVKCMKIFTKSWVFLIIGYEGQIKLTQYSTVFPETLKCLTWSRNSPNFIDSERSFHCQELNITCHYLQPYESNVRYPIIVLKDQF
jgi:hypothetical protein